LRHDTVYLLSGSLLVSMSISVMFQMGPVQTTMLKATYTDVGLLMGMARNLPYVMLSPLTAVFLSRISWNLPMPLSAAAISASLIVIAYSTDLTMVLASQLLMGVGLFLFFPCGESIVAYSFGGRRLKGFSLFLTAVSGGFLAGSVVAGSVAYIAGLKTLFISSAATSMLGGLLLARLRPVSDVPATSIESFTALPKPILLSIPYFTMLAASYSLVPSYLILRGFTELEIGVVFFCLMTARMAVSYIMARFSAKTVKRSLVVLSILLGFLYLSASFTEVTLPMQITILAVLGAVVSVAYVKTLVEVSDIPAASTFYIGVFETFIGLSFLTGPPVAGMLADNYGFENVLKIFGALSLFSAAVNFGLSPRSQASKVF
jgi:MFS family permease